MMLTNASEVGTSFHSSASAPMSSISHAANSVTNAEILKLVMQLHQQVLDMGKGQKASASNKPKPTFIRNQTHKYCWTHGACGHDSKQCRNKQDGHRDEATFADKMGGNEQFCKPTQDQNKSDNHTL